MKKILLTMCLFASIAISAQTITYNGDSATDNEDWFDADNWDLDIVPTAAHDVVIPDGFNVKIKSTGAVANSINASGTGKLQINAEKDLTVTGNLVGGSSSNIFFVTANNKNMGTLIFGGTYTGGNTSAKIRLPNNNKWHLISAPLKQATINNFINDATTIVSKDIDPGAPVDQRFSLATYNDGNASGSKYTYFTDPLPNTTDKLEKGQGYSTLLNNTGDTSKPDMQFKGKFNDGDVFSPTLVHAGNGFVLLGNPFTAYIYANENADATKNILTVNTGKLDQETLWFWDSANDDWETRNQSDAAFHIAPGQGYFVKVKSGVSGKFRTNLDMQTHAKTDGFFKSSNNRFEIDLSISNANVKRKTSIRYINGTTTSFDNGYDSSMFSGLGNNFAVFTNLVENNVGEKLAIQSLPDSEFETMIIPVGVIAEAGDITFSTETLNSPSGIKVFLEDRETNTFTRLDEVNSSYKVKLEEKEDGIGRFYLHTKSSILNTNDINLESISIYKTNDNTLKIAGLSQEKATVKIFSILGKQVLKTSFTSSGVKEITLPNVSKGVYIVQLETKTGKLNKKITLN